MSSKPIRQKKEIASTFGERTRKAKAKVHLTDPDYQNKYLNTKDSDNVAHGKALKDYGEARYAEMEAYRKAKVDYKRMRKEISRGKNAVSRLSR